MNDQEIEQEIQAKGLTAPRVTPDDVNNAILREYYFTAAEGCAGSCDAIPNNADYTEMGLLTFCVLILQNGFMVTGESVCASPENFDAQLGREIARKNAVQKVWPLMGFLLKDMLAEKAERLAENLPVFVFVQEAA